LPPSPRSHIQLLKPVFHGGVSFVQGIPPVINQNITMDFSTCCNPYGPAKSIRSAMNGIDSSHYPDPDSRQFVSSLSKKLGVPAERIIAGSGSTEIIRLAAQVYFGPGDTVVIPSPTYSEYGLACTIVNAIVVKYPISENSDFQMDCDEFISFARSRKPAGIFLCNPNNPTGQYLSIHDVLTILDAFPDTLVVLDEAYIAFTMEAWDSRSLLTKNNLLIVRSMTKDFALAGLRLGYALGCEEIIENLKKVRPPWNVSSAAQSAGIAALSSDIYLSNCTEQIGRSRTYLAREISNLGYHVVPTRTNFFIFKTGDAAKLRKRLLKKGILVRDCASFGLPDYVRIAPLRITQCKQLIKALKEIQEGRR
jgi:histidinol-phosphate aminotransferase